ncbi:hypothetical protein KEM48_009494 [Puccinia striiformis f. sp. tritici PST-130]|nr:hypothetical protein KEM48_009494 [Puccinia striiformis f. sp. tritici PST-130]
MHAFKILLITIPLFTHGGLSSLIEVPLFGEPTLQETFDRIYKVLALPPRTPVRSPTRTKHHTLPKNPSPRQAMKTKDTYIAELIEDLKIGHLSGASFQALLVTSLVDIYLCGKIDITETWERYMVTDFDKQAPPSSGKKSVSPTGIKSLSPPARRKKSNSPPGKKSLPPAGKESLSDSNQRLIELHERLRRWCMLSGSTIDIQHDLQGWMNQKMYEIDHWEVVPQAAWELAANFVTLSMVWKQHRITHHMVTQMALFRHFEQFERFEGIPDEISKTITRVGGKNAENVRVIRRFYKWANSNARTLDTPRIFHSVVTSILPEPHALAMIFFPTISDYAQSCKQEYFAITELVTLCQEIGPRMASQDKTFWERLEIVAEAENLQPLMRAYQDLCHHFKDGAPLEKMFEYYQLINRISLEFKQLKERETRQMISAHIDQLSRIESKDSAVFEKGQARKADHGRIAKEKFDRVLRDRVNLVANYAEELYQSTRMGFHTKDFQPTRRATNHQLYQIASLLCGISSPIQKLNLNRKDIDRISVVNGDFNMAVYNSRLPTVIKHKMNSLSSIIQHKAVLYGFKAPSDPHQPDERMWKLWSKELLEAMEVQEDSGKEIERLPLGDNLKIWKAVKSTTDREFRTVTEPNAEILVNFLDRAHRTIWSQYIFDKIYETISNIGTFDERKIALGFVWNQLKKLEPESDGSQRLITRWEFNNLKKVYDSMHENLKEVSSSLWQVKVLPRISNLSIDLQKLMDDIFEEIRHRPAEPKDKSVRIPNNLSAHISSITLSGNFSVNFSI